MSTYQRFEDLPVWQTAAELFGVCDDFLDDAPPRLRGSFRNQLERAVLSVSNNIAEGFERGTTNELLSFLYIARGSAGEVRSMLIVLSRRPWAAPLTPQIARLIALVESCSRQLRAWADSLQNSDITGPRHLNNQTRANYEKRQSRKDGLTKLNAKLDELLPPGHPARREPSSPPPQPSQSSTPRPIPPPQGQQQQRQNQKPPKASPPPPQPQSPPGEI